MGWYKYAIDFQKRNLINHKIIYLKELREILSEMKAVVFQSATTAKNANTKILNSKKITSYPSLQDIFINADTAAFDSPWRFSSLYEDAIYTIDNKIRKLSREREEMTYPSTNPKKGWV